MYTALYSQAGESDNQSSLLKVLDVYNQMSALSQAVLKLIKVDLISNHWPPDLQDKYVAK